MLTIGAVVLPSTTIVYASENSQVVSLNENNATENVVIEYTEDGNIAVTTGVAANAINAAFWAGGKLALLCLVSQVGQLVLC